ncbi:MAG: hypothetical protein IPP41_15385 [Rhodocyclaceae bacterium]|nr:hypothetical protein [Rhodocyclaceae bacterium]
MAESAIWRNFYLTGGRATATENSDWHRRPP